MMAKVPQSVKKILLIRLSSLGDVLLTTPLIRELRKKFPTTQIDFVVRSEYVDLVRYNPNLNNILVFRVATGWGGLRLLRKTIREKKYDVILDLHCNFRTVFLRGFSGKHLAILKVRKNQVLRFLLVKFKINLYDWYQGGPLSVGEKYLRAAKPMSISTSDLSLELHLSPEISEKGRSLWQSLANEKFRVVMAPGARHFTKRWPPDYYARLIRQVYNSYGWRTLLVGGVDEVQTVQQIQQSSSPDMCRSLAGELSILETAAVIREAPIFVSNDSGLMHIAAASGNPQIAIFGSTTRELGFFPLNDRAIVLENQNLRCRPCSHIGRSHCPRKHFRCMLELTPDQVFRTLETFLEENMPIQGDVRGKGRH